MEQPGQRDLHRCSPDGCRSRVKRSRLQRVETAERKERYVDYTSLRQIVDESIVVSVCNIVEILHTHDLRRVLCLGQLLSRDIAQSDMANQPLALELDEHSQRFFNRFVRRSRHSSHPEIDNVKALKAKISQVIMAQELIAERIQFNTVEARSSVRDRLRREGVDAKLGDVNRFTTVADVIDHFQSESASLATSIKSSP